MQKNNLPHILIIAALLFFLSPTAYAQLPQSNLIYMNMLSTAPPVVVSDSLYQYDPTQPVSATNPSINTIRLPDHNGGLAISPVLGGTDTTLTFYTIVNSTFWYYDHNTTNWVNTGDSIGETSAVNIGAGGGHIYTMRAFGFLPAIYRYDGTGNAVWIQHVVFPLPYDLIVDCSGNFYVMSSIGPSWSMTEYDYTGVILQGYTADNTGGWVPSGGMANIGNQIYMDNGFVNGTFNSNFIKATVSSTNITFDSVTANMPFLQAGNSVGDMANVPSKLSDILPFISISTTDTVVCPGSSASFSSNVTNAGVSGHYQWFVNNAPQAGATNSTFTYQPANSDTVSLHYISSASCGSVTAISAGILIRVGLPLTHIDYGKGPFCGTAGLLSPMLTGAQGGSYAAPAGLTINSTTGVINTITSTPGTYIVTYTVSSSGICAAVTTATDTVTINAADFNISAAIPASVSTCNACDGAIVLHGLAPGQIDTVSYTSNGVAQPRIVGTVAADSTIRLTNLCAATYIIQIKSGPCAAPPVSVIVAGPALLPAFTYTIHFGCNTDTVVFSNNSIVTGSPAYQWTFGDQSIDTISNPIHIYAAQATYNVQLQASSTGCSDTTAQSIAIIHPLSASFTESPDTICMGQLVTFTNTSIGTNPAYQWHFDDGGNDTASNPSYTFNHAGIFNVTLIEKDFIPCFDSVSHILVVDSVSSVNFTVNDSILCQGQSAVFTCNCLTQNNAGAHWDFGDNTTIKDIDPVKHAYELPGAYNITFSASFRACPDTTFSRIVSVHPYPSINIGPDTVMCPGAPPFRLVDTLNTGNHFAHWVWNTGDTTASTIATAPGIYYATVILNNCANTDTIFIRNDCYISLPNVFTPNGDGVNDYFFPRQFLSASMVAFKMNIYNRWGQLVFTTNATDGRGWDGKFNNEPQPDGVFIYVIDASFENGAQEHHNGNVTLLR